MLASCNQVFALEASVLAEAAPPRCPSDGAAPVYARAIIQAVPQDCFQYTISATTGRATAMCIGELDEHSLYEGELDELLLPATIEPSRRQARNPGAGARR